MSRRQSDMKFSNLLEGGIRKEWINVPASATKDEVSKEFFVKGKSPILDAINWKERINELRDLAVHAKFYKVHMIVENSDLLVDSLKNELRYIGKQWVILK